MRLDRLFSRPDGRTIRATYTRTGEIRTLSVVTVTQSANGTTYTAERGVQPRSAEFGELSRAIRHASKTTA